ALIAPIDAFKEVPQPPPGERIKRGEVHRKRSSANEAMARSFEAGMQLIELARLWTVDAIPIPGRDETTKEIMDAILVGGPKVKVSAPRWLKKATGNGSTQTKEKTN